jgi:hypothetical protein
MKQIATVVHTLHSTGFALRILGSEDFMISGNKRLIFISLHRLIPLTSKPDKEIRKENWVYVLYLWKQLYEFYHTKTEEKLNYLCPITKKLGN